MTETRKGGMVSACGTGGPHTVSLLSRESCLEHSDSELLEVPLGRMKTNVRESGNCVGQT